MKKILVLFTLSLAASLAAQQATPPSNAKPSATGTYSSSPRTLTTPEVLGQNEMALPVGTAIRMKLETPLATSIVQAWRSFRRTRH